MNEHMNGLKDERKGDNHIPFGINARDINKEEMNKKESAQKKKLGNNFILF